MNKTLQELNNGFEKLTIELQDFIMSEVVQESVQLIAEEYGIEDDTLDTFSKNIFSLLIGEGSIGEFLSDLEHSLGFSEDDAQKIVLEVSELILEPASYLVLTSAFPTDTKPKQQFVQTSGTEATLLKTMPNAYGNSHEILIPEHLSELPTTPMTVPIPDPRQQTATASHTIPVTQETQKIPEEDPTQHTNFEKLKYTTIDPYREPPTA